ncbi:MAG: hypothetical protein HY435_01485 [Candidatus Liptonbacteria bacterium]|nr:hypothetical protein [Candidatus Liptonbacteria bacterium]
MGGVLSKVALFFGCKFVLGGVVFFGYTLYQLEGIAAKLAGGTIIAVGVVAVWRLFVYGARSIKRSIRGPRCVRE